MKSELEIKEFIDSREVLSKNELGRFIYGYKNSHELTLKWWLYVLHNKNLVKLKKYQKEKETHNSQKERILGLISKDKRLRECGTRKMIKILNEIYNIKTNRRSIQHWRELYEASFN